MRIVFTWEWGGGSGHLRLIAPLADHLLKSGHEVAVVTRDLTRTGDLFPERRVQCLQSPLCTTAVRNPIRHPATIADLAWNLGLNDVESMSGLFRGWTDLFRLLRPDVVIADFGLASSIVAWALQLPRLRVGTGYTCPPQSSHLVAMSQCSLDEGSRSRERRLIEMISSALKSVSLPSDLDWSDIILSDQDSLLATLPPLDPYHSHRPDADYVGIWDAGGGGSPTWPTFGESKTVAYLKPFPSLPKLLEALRDARVATALVGDSIPADSLDRFAPHSVASQPGMIDFSQIARECRFAICNANHGTSAHMLSLGIPLLAVRLYLEQRITADTIQRNGWGIRVDPHQPDHFSHAIETLRSTRSYSDAAATFASKYHSLLRDGLPRALERIDLLLGGVL
jgi:hypothetical protein